MAEIDKYALRQAILRTMKAFMGAPLTGEDLAEVSQERAVRLAQPEQVLEAFHEMAAMGYLEAIEGFGGHYHRISRKGLEQLLPEFRQEPYIWGPGAV
jgi:hypothetical protein